MMFLEFKSLNPSRAVSWCLVFWVQTSVKTATHTYWFHLDKVLFLQLVSSVCEKLSSFLDFLVIRNILTFSISKRKRRRLLKNDSLRYINLLVSVAVSLLWSINMFSSISWQWKERWFLLNSNRHRAWYLSLKVFILV